MGQNEKKVVAQISGQQWMQRCSVMKLEFMNGPKIRLVGL